MRNIKHLLLISGFTAAAALAGLTGCQTWGQHGERTAGRMVDDHSITRSVKSELRNEPVFKFNDVDVRTYNGVVQLSGFVNTEEQKRRAADLAQHVPGVSQVVNAITLKSETPTPTGRPAQP